ncbi:MAG: glycosyltransferase [Lachnospiraceae bacterium]
MKILFISAANSIHTVKWVNSLSERGHQVYLIYNSGHEPRQDKICSEVKLHPLKHMGTIAYYLNARELSKKINEIAPDIINVHYASGYGTLARIAKIKPYLLSIWGSDVYEFPYRNKLNKWILKKNIEYADKIASTSSCMADELRHVLKIENLPISITPFGVDLNAFNLNKRIPKRDNQIILGCIKTLKPIYGIDEFIKAVSCMLQKIEENKADFPHIEVHIYGEGNQKEELVRLVETLHLGENVCFKGKIPNDEVPKVLGQIDVFCATSIKESFGVSVVEAMAMEVPVVVSDADGFKEVVENRVTGIIVPRRDTKALALALEELILDKAKRIQYGKNGRIRVKKLYDWDKNVDAMEKIYEEMKQYKSNR